MRSLLFAIGLAFTSVAQAVPEDDSEVWVVGGGAGRIIDHWPASGTSIRLSEHLVDGGTKLCSLTISPDSQNPHRSFSVQHYQGQRGFTIVAQQDDWYVSRREIVQLSAVFDHQLSVELVGTGIGQGMKLASDISATPKLNTLLSESKSLDVEFPGRPGLTWRIDLANMPKAMTALRRCAAKNASG